MAAQLLDGLERCRVGSLNTKHTCAGMEKVSLFHSAEMFRLLHGIEGGLGPNENGTFGKLPGTGMTVLDDADVKHQIISAFSAAPRLFS